MKKITALFLVLLFLLCACNSQTANESSTALSESSAVHIQESSNASTEDSSEEYDLNESLDASSSTESSEDSAEDVSQDESDIEPEEESKEETDESKGESEESKEESNDEPKNVLAPGNPIQKTHQTPEILKESSETTDITAWQEKSPITPIFVVIRDSDMSLDTYSDYSIIKKAGLKVWICTKDGKKVDYVYTNSKGVAAFEAMEGEYTFYFEGNDKYAPRYYHKTVKVREVYSGGDWTYQYGTGYKRIRYPIYSYVEENHKDFKVYVTDAETGEPINNACVTVQAASGNYEAYTDANGVATTKSLLGTYDGGSEYKNVMVTASGYGAVAKDVSIMDNEVRISLQKTVYNNVKITCVDAVSGKPIQGVVATQKNIDKWDKDSYLVISESGADGVISLIVTDNTINAVGSQGLVLSYTDSDGMTISCEYNLFGAHGKKNVEYTLKLEKTDSGYVIRGMYD